MRDAIDLSLIDVVGGSPADALNWPITTTIEQVKIDTDGVALLFDAQERWPGVVPPGWDGAVQYTIWLFMRQLGHGRWLGAGIVEFWKGRPSTGDFTQETFKQHLFENWIRDDGWPANSATLDTSQLGFMVTGGDQRKKNVVGVAERSNIVLVPFPTTLPQTLAFHDEPPPPPPPPSHDPTETALILMALGHLNEAVTLMHDDFNARLLALEQKTPAAPAVTFPTYAGSVFGATLVLRPQTP